MARYRHYRNHGAERQWVFVTTTCLDFVHAFREPATRDLMAASLIEDLSYYGSVLHAFVVMPHHVHFIAVVPEGKTIGWLMNRVKSNAAHRILPFLSLNPLPGLRVSPPAPISTAGRQANRYDFRHLRRNRRDWWLSGVIGNDLWRN